MHGSESLSSIVVVAQINKYFVLKKEIYLWLSKPTQAAHPSEHLLVCTEFPLYWVSVATHMFLEIKAWLWAVLKIPDKNPIYTLRSSFASAQLVYNQLIL